MKFILIAGLPGSGKSVLGNQLAEKHNFQLIDDLIAGDVSDIYSKLSDTAKGIIICNHNFTLSTARQIIIAFLNKIYQFQCEFQWIYFENNPTQCLKNISDRNPQQISESTNFINLLTKFYTIPKNSDVRKVWIKPNISEILL